MQEKEGSLNVKEEGDAVNSKENNGGHHNDSRPSPTEIAIRLREQAWSRKIPILAFLIVAIIAVFPLLSVSYPPNVDLPEHILISKLLFEKLSGVSTLDMEISYFIAYRLIPIIFVAVFFVFNTLGISFLYVPKFIVLLLILFHTAVVTRIIWSGIDRDDLRKISLAAGFALPAVIAIYSACWFIGFVNFTLAITILIATIVLTERFIESGRFRDAVFVFIPLLLCYSAHPFAPVFWVIWCGSRFIASVATFSIKTEWRRLVVVPLIFLPIVLYHFFAIAGTEFESTGSSVFERPLLLGPAEWFDHRISHLFTGELLKADSSAFAIPYAITAVAMVIFAAIVAWLFDKTGRLERLALSSLIFVFLASVVNEKAFPIPLPHWLAYDYRFSSTTLAVCLVVAGFVLVKLIPAAIGDSRFRIAMIVAAILGGIGSLSHVVSVRGAYERYEPRSQEYLAAVFAGMPAPPHIMPNSRWHPDGTAIRHYECLLKPDCNSKGTTFESWGGALYAVRLNKKPSNTPQSPRESVSPRNALVGGRGTGFGEFDGPRGIAIDLDGNILVADTFNARIQTFDRKGNFVRAIGSKGDSESRLVSPSGIVVDASGHLLVTDASRQRLIRFDPQGNIVGEWTGPPDGLYGPGDIDVLPDGRILLIDQGNIRVVQFSPGSGDWSSWPIGVADDRATPDPTGIALGGDFVFIADKGNRCVKIFGLDGTIVRKIETPEWGEYIWQYPDVAFDPGNKSLFVTFGWLNEVRAYNLQGVQVELKLESERPDLHTPTGIVTRRKGGLLELVVLNTGGNRVSVLKL